MRKKVLSHCSQNVLYITHSITLKQTTLIFQVLQYTPVCLVNFKQNINMTNILSDIRVS